LQNTPAFFKKKSAADDYLAAGPDWKGDVPPGIKKDVSLERPVFHGPASHPAL
jgi:hypothetical protein